MNNFKDPEKYLRKVLNNWDAFNRHHAQLTNAIESILAENKMLRKKLDARLVVEFPEINADTLRKYMSEGAIKIPIGEPKIITNNHESIQAMAIDEMSEFICGIFDECGNKFICGTTIPHYDETKIREWLESEVD